MANIALIIAGGVGQRMGQEYEKMKKRFEVYVENEYFHIIEQNICNAFLDDYRFDCIVHGASNADPGNICKIPGRNNAY